MAITQSERASVAALREVQPSWDAEPGIQLPYDAVEQLGRALDTALANAEQHAPGASVSMTVQAEGGFAQLTRELGIMPGDLVNDQAGQRPVRGLIARAMPWRHNDERTP